MSAPLGVGIIGAGVISDTYLENLNSFPDIDVRIVGDLDLERAASQAEKHGVSRSGSAEDVLASDDVQLVVNLTIPAVHIEVSRRAIAAGKHVWTEKPIGLDVPGAIELLEEAKAAGLRVGSAPDTVLGPGFQTAKRAIARGDIGTPLFAQTAFQTQGPDLWHPSPQFLFAKGAGPLFDMGPYYFTGLVSLFGAITSVSAQGVTPRKERTIHNGPNAGERFPVEVPTSVQVLTSFAGGQQAQSLLSFDSALERHGVFEVHGTEGSMVIPDPNTFSGRTALVHPLGVIRDGMSFEQPWQEIPEEGVVVGRGLGVLDMARSIAAGRPHVASGELGLHVLEVMSAAQRSIDTGETVHLSPVELIIPQIPVEFDPFAATL